MQDRARHDPGSGFGPPKYPGTFLQAFREAAALLHLDIRRWLGTAVECADERGRNLVIGLENLYRLARRHEREEWPRLIGDFMRTAGVSDADAELTEALASVGDRLLPRLGLPLESLPASAQVWSQSLAETGLCVNLVIDRQKTFHYVTAEAINESGKDGPAWFEQAMANLRARTPADCFEVIDEESGLRLCAVGDAFDSSRALLLDTLLPEGAGDGFFVAVPARDCVLAVPVNAQALGFVHLLKVLAEKNFKTSPYSISDRVYWVREGVWRFFCVEVQGQQATIQPPLEFVEILDRLAPDKSASDLIEPSDN